MDHMVMLTLLNLIGRNSLLIDNPGDNICSLLSSNSISAALAVQEVLKSLSGTSAKCCNSCSSIWSRWWLNSYHFRKKRGIVGKRCDYCLKLAAWWCCALFGDVAWSLFYLNCIGKIFILSSLDERRLSFIEWTTRRVAVYFARGLDHSPSGLATS